MAGWMVGRAGGRAASTGGGWKRGTPMTTHLPMPPPRGQVPSVLPSSVDNTGFVAATLVRDGHQLCLPSPSSTPHPPNRRLATPPNTHHPPP